MNDFTKIFSDVAAASRELNLLSDEKINQVLADVAESALTHIPLLLAENEKDLQRMDKSDPKYDRLKLTKERIEAIATDMVNVTKLPSPLEKKRAHKTLLNGLQLTKISVPLGVVGIIYEARPNVTFDVFSLCLKSGNACVLKGGSDAEVSNKAIAELIHGVLKKHGINPASATLLPATRAATEALLNAIGFVDILIPRGSQNLIDYVRQHAKVPVIETGAGIVHTYFDSSADLEKGKKIIYNAKTRRVSVCNALDCLLVHEDRIQHLPEILLPLAQQNVIIYADEKSYHALGGKYPNELLQHAAPEHYGTEFLDYKLAVKTIASLDEALQHIARYSSKHSEAIVSEDKTHIDRFLKTVDAAVVYANASTAFTDGAQFGLGAEIGISTQKLHARGPMALEELTSYKWLVRGDGQVRS